MFIEILHGYGVEHDQKSTNFFELLKFELPKNNFTMDKGSVIHVTLNRTLYKTLLEPANAREELEVKSLKRSIIRISTCIVKKIFFSHVLVQIQIMLYAIVILSIINDKRILQSKRLYSILRKILFL